MLHNPTLGRAIAPRSVATASALYRCPVDRGVLECAAGTLTCRTCGTVFPVVDGIPVLINDANSVFRRSDFTGRDAYTGASGYGGAADTSSGLKRAYRRFARRLSEAPVPGTAAIDRLYRLIEADGDRRILVIGAGERASRPGTIRTDVAFAAGVDCICDAHDLPFADGAFDVVYAESVLEHVCDPQRCVGEMTRVLAPTGRVLAVTPFLQPVHMGAYDFTRFTHLGHRRLFRMYDEIGSGLCGGPAYAAIHILRNAVIGVTDNRRARSILRLVMLLLTYPWRYLDPWLSRRQSAYNAGCAFYFCGSKRDAPIPDREILRSFRGSL
jgi:SAM-dependent methyltransferase